MLQEHLHKQQFACFLHEISIDSSQRHLLLSSDNGFLNTTIYGRKANMELRHFITMASYRRQSQLIEMLRETNFAPNFHSKFIIRLIGLIRNGYDFIEMLRETISATNFHGKYILCLHDS